jgi:hypothetical protein
MMPVRFVKLDAGADAELARCLAGMTGELMRAEVVAFDRLLIGQAWVTSPPLNASLRQPIGSSRRVALAASSAATPSDAEDTRAQGVC